MGRADVAQPPTIKASARIETTSKDLRTRGIMSLCYLPPVSLANYSRTGETDVTPYVTGGFGREGSK